MEKPKEVALCNNVRKWIHDHTMFNAASTVFVTITMNWTSTIAANAAIIFVSITTIKILSDD